MQKDVEAWCQSCEVCGKYKRAVQKSSLQHFIKKFVICCKLPRCTLHTVDPPQATGMVERCNRILLAMLRAVSEQQGDWDDHLPAVLSAYRSTPHSSTGLSPYRMVYRVKMTMPIDLVVGEVGQQRPNVHCPVEYVGWLKGSIQDDHALARENLKKAAKRQKKPYGEASRNVCFQRGDFGAFIPQSVVVNCVIKPEPSGWCWLKLVLLLTWSNAMQEPIQK